MTSPISGKLALLGSNELDFFLSIVEAGSIRSGARKTRAAVNTVRRRLARIEDLMGEQVALRASKGLHLTDTGEHLAHVARQMRLSRAKAAAEIAVPATGQTVRIAVTEGLGTYWLMPRLVEFRYANPRFDINLHCDMQRVDVAGDEFDLAIQLEAPAHPAVITERIGMLHLMPFAADSYLREMGTPRSVDDWRGHKLVWQEADQVAAHLLVYHIGLQDPEGLIAIRTNSSSAHFGAIASGGGIGILPTYARALTRRVRPVDIGVRIKREILCILNPKSAGSEGVRLAMSWLRAAFAGDHYPWFGQNFVHPDEFEGAIAESSGVRLFPGFIEIPEF